MHEEIICAGEGGQGIMLMGKLLAQAGLIGGKEVTWMPSYGAEARGGTAHSMVVISDDKIASPVVINPTVCFAMNELSFKRFAYRVKSGGLLIANSSLIKKGVLKKARDIFWLPSTEIANRLGNTKVANMVALGVYLAKKKSISLKSALKALKIIFPDSKQELLSLNEAAIKEGMRLAVFVAPTRGAATT